MQCRFRPFGQSLKLRNHRCKNIAAKFGVRFGFFICVQVNGIILVHLCKESNGFGNIREHLRARLKDSRKNRLIHMPAACRFEIGFGMADVFLGRKFADVFRIHPSELCFIENCGRLAETLNAECFLKLVHGEKLAIVSRAPADKRNIVYNRLRKVTLCNQILKPGITVPLAELARRVLHNGCKVDVNGLFPAECFV